MKNFMNYSKFAIATLITAGAFVACSDEIEETPYSTQYLADVTNIKTAGNAVDLGLPSNTKWADMNVGAKSESDNGILFIWGDITGKKMTAESNAYGVNPTTEAALFEMYKGDPAVGYVYDTLCVHKEEMHPSGSFADSTAVVNTAKTYLDLYVSEYKENSNIYGKFEATITAEDVVLVYDSISSANPEECKGYIKVSKLNKDTKIKDLVIDIDKIDSTAVNYFVSKTGSNDIPTAIDNLVANSEYDPATANWGSNWCMPTKAQLNELMTKCTWDFTGKGYKVTGPNGNSIFLPAAGYRYGDKLIGNGTAGYYATGEILGTYKFPTMEQQINKEFGEITNPESMPNILIFQHGQFENSIKLYNNLTTNYGISIRPVQK